MTEQALFLTDRLKAQAAASEPLQFRQPPHNIDAEQALLGAILVNNESLDRVAGFLATEHFYDPLHGQIFEIASKLIQAGKQATPITLRTFFENAEPIDQNLTVPQYLGRLAVNATTIINAQDYGRTIYDLAVRRQLITIGEDLVNDAFQAAIDNPPDSQIQETEGKLYALAENGKYGQGFVSFGHALKESIEMANSAYQRDGHLSGLSTGLVDLDNRMGGLQPTNLIVLAGRPSMGKAQPLDAKVLTVAGWKAMHELKLGDRLASIDGRPSRVSGLFPQGRKPIYRVTFADGRSTECCAEHLWRVRYRAWSEPRVLSTAELIAKLQAKRYRGRLWIDTFSGEFGVASRLPVEPWLLGALIGDGTLSGSSVRFSTAEEEQLKRVQCRAGSTFALHHVSDYDYRIVTAAGRTRPGLQGVVPNALKEALTELGLWNKRSEHKFIPPAYLAAPRADRLELLRGLLDTDGWVERWGSIRYATSSTRLAEDVVTLARSLGATCSAKTKQPSYTHKGERRAGLTSHVVNIQHLDPESLFLLTHKKRRAKPRARQRRLTITSIEPSRTAEAQCIAVTHPDHLYITDDFIVTHNTALVTNIAFNVAKKFRAEKQADGSDKAVDGGRVGFFSLEMSAEQLATRILSEQAEIASEKIRRGMINEDEFRRLVQVSQQMAVSPLFIDQSGGITIAQLSARSRKLKRQHGLDLLIVDYLQLLSGSSKNQSASRVQEITEITTGLKALAKELEVPIIALSQLSRAVEQREDKRPQLSDLRESGSIEQDADVVMFVFREEYYVERTKPPEGSEKFSEWQANMERCAGKAEVIIGKQRHGPVGTVLVSFEAQYTRFGNLAKEHHYETGGQE